MQEKIFRPLGYYSIFWIWVIVFEPSLMRAANAVVHNGETSIVVALVTATAIIIEAVVWRSKIAHMHSSKTFPDYGAFTMVLWIGHMLGSMVVFMVFLSAVGIFNSNSGEFTAPSVVVLLLLMTLVIKEIVFLTQLMDETPKPPKHSLNVTNGGLLFATMIMHSCFWGLSSGSGAPLSSYGFWEMLLVQAPAAGLMFCIIYIPSRMLPFLEDCEQQTKTKAGFWLLTVYTFITMLFALKAIY